MVRKLTIVSFCLAFSMASFGSFAAAGGGSCQGAQVIGSGATDTRVTLERNCFTPGTLLVDPGDSVTFVNEDPVNHVVIGSHMRWGSTVPIEPGQEITHTFELSGIYAYTCNYHAGMTGVIVVGDGEVALAGAKPSKFIHPVGEDVEASVKKDSRLLSGQPSQPLVYLAFGSMATWFLAYRIGRRLPRRDPGADQ